MIRLKKKEQSVIDSKEIEVQKISRFPIYISTYKVGKAI